MTTGFSILEENHNNEIINKKVMERLDMNCWRRALNFGILLCCLMITVACSKEDDEESDPLLEALPSELTLTDNEDGSASGFITLNTNNLFIVFIIKEMIR